jgi:acetylornithine deacetylase/succinyl-diaminopimelate desuccinylase-like protein
MCTSRSLITLILCVAGLRFVAGQQSVDIQSHVRAYRIAHEKEIVQEFIRLVSLPNRATDTPDIERNAEIIKTMLEKRGVTVRLLRGPGSSPVVLGELRAPGVRPTIGIYAHYDGQPVDPSEWSTPPFSPVIRDQNGKDVDWEAAAQFDPEWRIYARSTSDDKAPIEATMAALDALRASNTPLAVNVKFMFEGEEEAGSTHLP